MRISARNQFKGKIVAIDQVVTTNLVKIDVGGGTIITASITRASADELKLAVGQDAVAIIKASDVMVGVL